jgi:hypothetical protein
MPEYASVGSPFAQGGFAMFGVERNPVDQPAVDAMAADYLTKRHVNAAAALLGKPINNLVFDSNEAAALLGNPVVNATQKDATIVRVMMLYEYLMTADFVLAWIRNLSNRIDNLQGTATSDTVVELTKKILRPDYAAWNIQSGVLVDLEPDGTKKVGHMRSPGGVADLATYELAGDIMRLSLGFGRPCLFDRTEDAGDTDNTKVPRNGFWNADMPHRVSKADGTQWFKTGGSADALYVALSSTMKAPYQASNFGALAESAMVSGFRDYIGGKYADLMQKFWVALKTSSVVLGHNATTWAQSLDSGPLLGRRYQSCGPNSVPYFLDKDGKEVPTSDAIMWFGEVPHVKPGVVLGGCTPGVPVGVGAGPRTRYGATVADALSHRGREGLPFDASAILLNELPGYKKKTKMASRHRKRKRHSKSKKIGHKKKRSHKRRRM